MVPCNKSVRSTAHNGHIPLPNIKLKRCVFKILSLRPLDSFKFHLNSYSKSQTVSSLFSYSSCTSPSHQIPGLQFADTEVDPWNEAKSVHGSWRNTACPIRVTLCTVCSSNINNQIWSSTASPAGSANMFDTKGLFAIFSHILFVAQLDVPHMNEQKFARCGFIIHQRHLRHWTIYLAKLLYFTNLGFPEIRSFPY